MWAVTWERDGVRYLIDVDDEVAAYRLAVAISESGRAAVAITPCDLDLDEETRERIKQRIAERLRAEGVMA
jgi:phosphoribosylaminoimidazole carboxylase (NCAIR synthetase)